MTNDELFDELERLTRTLGEIHELASRSRALVAARVHVCVKRVLTDSAAALEQIHRQRIRAERRAEAARLRAEADRLEHEP